MQITASKVEASLLWYNWSAIKSTNWDIYKMLVTNIQLIIQCRDSNLGLMSRKPTNILTCRSTCGEKKGKQNVSATTSLLLWLLFRNKSEMKRQRKGKCTWSEVD